jgi:hypothetical protein
MDDYRSPENSPEKHHSRRSILGAAGLSIATTGVLDSAAARTEAADTDPQEPPVVRIEDQTTAGNTITVARAAATVESFLLFIGQYGPGGVTAVEEDGVQFEDKSFRLKDPPFKYDQQLTAKLYTTNGEGVLTQDTAQITVAENPEQH